MTQSKLESLIESLMNILIGWGVALFAQSVMFPLYGIHVPMSTNLEISAWFTLISLVRSYTIRRWFNGRLRSMAQSMVRSSTNA